MEDANLIEIVVIALMLVCGLFFARLAGSLGRSAVVWFVLGASCPLIALIIFLVLPNRAPRRAVQQVQTQALSAQIG